MGTALILLAATSDDRLTIASAVLMNQLLKTAEALRDYHRATGNARQAQAIDQRVLQPLGALKLGGTDPTTTAPRIESQWSTQSPLPNPLEPRLRITARTTPRGERDGRER